MATRYGAAAADARDLEAHIRLSPVESLWYLPELFGGSEPAEVRGAAGR